MEQEATTIISNLSKSGTVGVMIALILLCGFVMWLLYRIVSNHINHSNSLFEKNASIMTELVQTIENLKDIIKLK